MSIAGVALTAGGTRALAGLAVPAYSSDPGAPYTIYLDFGGFNFTGAWGGGTGAGPGNTPALGEVGAAAGDTAGFTADLPFIQKAWSGVANQFSAYNINVTTVDPAVAAGQAGTDLARQNYYDSQPQMMHTIVGGSGSSDPNASSVSYLGVTAGTQVGTNGYHTNFMFAGNPKPTDVQYVYADVAHENGHGFGLYHQSDYNETTNTLINEYSNGTALVSPTMAGAFYSQRALFAIGTKDTGVIQNDAQVILSNANIGGFKNDGIGHTALTATPLALTGTGSNNVNFNLDKGVIVPLNSAAPATSGSGSYQPDYFSFVTTGGLVTLTANSGEEYITPGTADQGATLKTMLDIYSVIDGSWVYASPVGAITATSTVLNETFSATLGAGAYDAEIMATGDAIDTTSNNRTFFDDGAFFLTGTVPTSAVPEPTTIALATIGSAGLLARRRRAAK